MINPLYDYQFRLILIGDSMVGKSSLVRYFSEGKIASVCDPTVGVDFFHRHVELRSGITIKLQLWDTAGQEKFRSITKAYYRNSVAGFLVFDMTHRQTFDNMEEWYEEARRSLLCPPKFLLVGHKADMAEERRVSHREARQFARERDMDYVETSAVTGQNVESAFVMLAEQVYNMMEEGRYKEVLSDMGWDGIKKGYGQPNTHFALTDSGEESNSSSGCCK